MTRVFDTDYVKNNILVNDSLGAVHLIIGEEAVKSEKNIQIITEANENIQLLIQNKIELTKRLNDQLYSEMAEKLSEAKQKFSMDRSINQKVRAKVEPMAALTMWYADIDTNTTEVGSSSELEDKKQSLLSEGERRFIAFIHFYYDLFKVPEEKIADGVSTVIIDDPITSLDSDNRFYLTELTNGFIKFAIKSKVQVVVLTHSSQDFHNFAYGSGKDTKWFRIVKDEQGKSSVESVSQEEKNNYSDYYRTTFESLMSFAQLSKRKLNESHLSYGNKARVIFESHAKSHYKLMYATKASYPEIKKFYEIPDELDAEVQRMLDVINSLSHGLTIIDDLDISPKELQTNVRTLLHILWLKDEQHVLQMVGNKINRENLNDTMEWLS